MGVRFIIGGAGSGKSQRCLDELTQAAQAAPAGPPLILLVPEQATFQVEQALLGSGRLKGIIRAQVLSFQRLAWRVSLKAGGLALPPLSDLGKQMVLRALLEKKRDDLRLFHQVADKPGFIERVAGSIRELRSYRQGPESLRRQLSQLEAEGLGETSLGAKLHDLALVMDELRSYIEGRFTDPDEYLTVLAARLEESRLLEGAEVWVDGFNGFTPQELAVLGAVMRSARQVHISLCIPPGQLYKAGGHHSPSDLFHPVLSTYDQLMQLAAESGVAVDPPLYLNEPLRFRGAPELAHVERYLFRQSAPAWPGAPERIALVEAQNRREEVAAAAREILRLVREEGLRFREIAVVARDLEGYGDLAATLFAEHGIPAFIDRRRTVAHHPLVELLRAALEVVVQDWAYGPVFRYLKTDLTGVSRAEIDLLENYVIEHGIRGRAWQQQEPWQYLRRYTLEEDAVPAGPAQQALLDEIHRIRRRATAPLLAFQRRLQRRGRPGPTVREITTYLFQLLDDLKVARQLEAWKAEAEQRGDLETAREHEQVWTRVLELFDQIVEGLGDQVLSPKVYLQVLSAGLDGLKLGLIPPGLDQVIVGTVERSRHAGVRATLILGATEKDFPPQPAEDAIFTDRERERLKQSGLDVGPTSLERLFQEQFLTYVALTRGSDFLWISYPLADESGRAAAPSPVVGRMRRLFPELKPRPAAPPAPDAEAAVAQVATPRQLAAAVARALRRARSGYAVEPHWLDLYQCIVLDPDLHREGAAVLAAVGYEEWLRRRGTPVGRELARLLYGDRLVTSVSRLEAFLSCPFRHFAGYALRLQGRAEFTVSAPEFGLFYHAALSLFVRELERDGLAWDTLTPDEAWRRMDSIIDRLAPRLQSEILLSSPQHRYLLRVIRRTLQSSLDYLSEHVLHGEFRPVAVEVPFGEEMDGLPPVEVDLPGGGRVLLRGRIDRVDALEGRDGRWYVRVIDYKSGRRDLRLGDFYHGLTLQLLLYLMAVVEGGEPLLPGTRVPAGALYLPVYDPVEPVNAPVPPDEVRPLRRKRYQARGLVSDDPAVIQAMDAAGLGLIQAKLKKDGTVYKGAPVASPDQFRQLFAHLRRVVRACGEQILQGEAAIAPYRLGPHTACQYCAYRPVCQFDPAVEPQGYRRLEKMDAPDVWQRVAAAGGEGDV
ncbi:helicase-exonuclease AddAB subunit AddB [Symbiobacterium thermophilum]|uniref:helicase-exonuclease AddAB subunit AddB n=1 Tax=Symbiobacterium thermophilum TaxID=2734 RepID=UPI00030486E4|nr:helicase-exonuclease AddAB subunit AddB [Symbiobacterium thermophilum]